MPTHLRTQYLLVSLLIALVHAGPREWRVDADTREALCANQQAMCSLSCQSNIITNTCDLESLAWTCTCSGVPAVPSYLLPIPFELCRNELWACIEGCEAKTSEHEPGEHQQRQQQRSEIELQTLLSVNEDTANILALIARDDDFDQDDFDAIAEVRLLQQTSRLESHPYYRSSNDAQDFVSASKQRQILHKEQWLVAQALNPLKIENISLTVHNKVLKNSECPAQCDAKLACGTDLSPDYTAGLDSVYTI